MKAFLSHSSIDKEFIRKVSTELGRQFCVFDEHSFENGEDFINSIIKGLDDSCIFVLFATRSSLKSLWVKFEIHEAAARIIRKQISNAVVYQLEAGIEISEYPEWLRRAKISIQNTPKIVARDIRQNIEKALRDRHQQVYIERPSESDLLTDILTSFGKEHPARIALISGLPGQGRRSLLRKIIPSLLNFQRSVEITVAHGDSVTDLAIKLADQSEPYSTSFGLEEIAKSIRQQTENEILQRITNDIATLQSAREFIILIDDGGLINNDGHFRPHIEKLLETIYTNPTIYCFIVTSRVPRSNLSFEIPRVSVRELPAESTKRLLTLAARQSGIHLSTENTTELADFVAGYPPAAFYAISQAKAYGIDIILNDKRNLVEFRTGVFIKHLSGQTLTTEDKNTLQLLSTFSPLPFKVIASSLPLLTRERHAEILTRLIDLSLIFVDAFGHYRISEPIAAAVDRVLGFPPPTTSSATAASLEAYLAELGDLDQQRGLLDILRVTFRATQWSNLPTKGKQIISLNSDLYKLIEDLFHSGEYERSIDFCLLYLQQQGNDTDVLYFLIRGLINIEKWDESDTWIKKYALYAPKKDVDYIVGYKYRKMSKIQEAIAQYKAAESGGRGGTGLSRELALCYLINDQLADANKYLSAALAKDRDNRFLIDLGIQIAIAANNEPEARRYLERLKLVDSEPFYYHRVSRVEYLLENLPQALTAAEHSNRLTSKPSFSMLAHYLMCLIETNNIKESDSILASIEEKFKGRYHDIKLGLKCKIAIAKSQFDQAIGIIEKTTNKESPIYQLLRLESINGLLRTSALADFQRSQYINEKAKIEHYIKGINRLKLSLLPIGQ